MNDSDPPPSPRLALAGNPRPGSALALFTLVASSFLPCLSAADLDDRFDAAFERRDGNGNGVIDPDEIRSRSFFGQVDANDDGSLTRQELRAHLEIQAKRRRRRAEAPADAPYGESYHTLEVDGRERGYLVQAPKEPEPPLPLVFFFHGGGGRAGSIATIGFRELTAERNFLAVYPQAWKNHWNDGREARAIPAQVEGVDDVTLVRAIVRDLSERHEIDRSRIFATGVSSGAMFSHYLATRAADLVAAIAPVAGGLPEPLAEDFAPSRPVSLLVIQGDADSLVPIDGGPINDRERRGRIIGTEATLEKYLARAGIEGSPTVEEVPDRDPDDGTTTVMTRYPTGDEGTRVVYYRVEGGGHTLPGSDRSHPPARASLVGKTSHDFDGLEVIADFFENCAPRRPDLDREEE